MYTEEYENKGFPIRGFVIKLIILIAVVALLFWLVPKVLSPAAKTDVKATCNGSTSCDLTGVNALTSQIFADNLEKMKDAAISYYTAERVPTEVGGTDQMTLSDMIGKKLIVALIDKNNKAVDVEKSYVKITKMNEEYLLKVNIKDSEKEDYILVHIGCYSYCDSYVCQKQETQTTTGTKSGKINPVVPIGTPTPTPSPSPSTPVIPENPKCENKNGKYYDRNGNIVSEVNYIISCQAPKCQMVNGYYFGKNGDSVTKSRYESECSETPSYKCTYARGNYYDINGNVVNEVNYIISCQAPVCRKVNGYYFGKYGTNVSKSTYESECTTPTPSYKCTYANGNYYDINGNVVNEINYIISCQAPVCRKVNGYYFGKYGTNVSKATYESECTTPTPSYKCTYANGNYYDINGNVVSEINYIISCQAPVCRKVNGYYFGKYGTNVSKATYESECTTPTPSYKCTYANGNYYDKNGNVVSEVNYIISCQAPKCRIVNGYYFGKNGNNVNKSTYESECTTPTPEYLYEYTKTTGATLSNWTSWSSWAKTDCSTKEINCSDTSASCLYKLQLLKRKEKIGTYQKTYTKTRQMLKQTGSYQQKSCSNYSYVEINKTIYATTTTTTYTTISTITSTTQRSSGGWTYNGRASYSNPPTDTATTHYKFVGADYSYCGETCTTLPNYYYDAYTVSASSVSSTTTAPGSTTSSSSSSTSPVGSSTSYSASCGSYVTKTIPIYGYVTVAEKATRTEPLYGDVCYQSTKSRSVTSQGSTQTKWSTYNDTSLLNNGWSYTGRRKTK